MARYALPGAYGIARSSFDDVDILIRSLRQGTREFQAAESLATRLLAHATQGFAVGYMSGPSAPASGSTRYVRSSFGIPVRVITGRSRAGWKVRRVSLTAWEVYNEERGAWMVEHGIVAGGGAKRRPILRMSGVATLRFIQRTRFAQRMMADTFGNLRNNRGHFRSFENRIRPFMLRASGRPQLGGPMGRIPG